ncbi:MAG: hypothetical protein EXS31_14900 [Pedosphaera sp.]|nr:hypothetical protein [Pedosphaera sp.]
MKLLKHLQTSILIVACIAGLQASAADKKADKADSKAAKDNYPLKTCVVSDEKLGEMGAPFVFKHEGKDVKLCCESCKKDFTKNPAKFMKKLSKAEKKANNKS